VLLLPVLWILAKRKFLCLIDHIYVNNVNQSYISGVIISDLVTILEPSFYASNKKKHYDDKKIHRIRDMGNFYVEMFLEELSNELNTSNLSDCNAVNEKFNNSLAFLSQLLISMPH